ncbi:hypothetical protein AX14_007484 [Amanita brunnescens Koide BX004]|nr:hypothetical protein AX14_007484 [Amanita brunnescens Koide BX004]
MKSCKHVLARINGNHPTSTNKLILSGGLMDLVRINTTIGEARRELHERSRGLPAFAAKYLSHLPKPEVVSKNTRDTTADTSTLFAISDVLDIEEDIWLPTLWSSRKARCHRLCPCCHEQQTTGTLPPNLCSRSNFFFNAPSATTVEVLNSGPTPFEIKTGRANAGMPKQCCIPYWRGSAILPSYLPAFFTTRKAKKNELASWMMERIRTGRGGAASEEKDVILTQTFSNPKIVELKDSFLPPTIDDERAYIYKSKTSDLTASHRNSFKWEALLSFEERDITRFKKEL